jgi:hypothetical protein
MAAARAASAAPDAAENSMATAHAARRRWVQEIHGHRPPPMRSRTPWLPPVPPASDSAKNAMAGLVQKRWEEVSLRVVRGGAR